MIPTTLRISILLLSLFWLHACGLLPEQVDKTKGWSAQKFYSEASSALADGEYTQAIEYYEGLEARYPFGKYAMQSQLDIAYAHYKNGDSESAINAADRFIRLHPRNPYVDYAYYLKGVVNFTRNLSFLSRFLPTDTSQRDPGASLESFNDFSTLVRKYPQSQYADDARKRMFYLRNNLASHEIHAARYYMKKGAWLAAANRANRVVEQFQRTPAVAEALEIMIEAYAKLGLDDLSADAEKVLALNQNSGNLVPPDDKRDEKRSLGKWIWDYLELDKN